MDLLFTVYYAYTVFGLMEMSQAGIIRKLKGENRTFLETLFLDLKVAFLWPLYLMQNSKDYVELKAKLVSQKESKED